MEDYKSTFERLKRKQSARQGNIEDWEDLYNLVDKNKTEGLESSVSNKPRTDMNLAVHILSSREDKPRIVAAGEDLATRRTFSKAERGIVGIRRVIDDQYADTGRGWLARDSAFKACLTGSIYRLTGVLSDDGSPIFLAENWETKDCYPGWGETELRRFLHEYEVDIEVFEEKAELHGWNMPDLKKGAETVNIQDYYKKEGKKIYRVTLVANTPLEEMHEIEGFDEIPVRGGQVAEGNSLLEPNRIVWRTRDRFFSYQLRAIQFAIDSLILVETDMVKPIVEEGELGRGRALMKQVTPGTKATNVELIRALPLQQLNVIEAMLGGDDQRGGFSYAAYGNIPGETPSGYLYSLMMQGTLLAVGPFQVALNKLDSRTYRDWLLKFKEGSFKPIEIAGNTSGRLDGYFHERFSRKDVTDFMYVHVDRSLALPDRKMELAAIMNQLAPQLPQKLSHYTMLDEVYGVDDPLGELDRIAEDAARMSGEMQALERVIAWEAQADDMEAKGRVREAEIARRFARAIIANFEREGQQGQREGEQPRVGPEAGMQLTKGAREDTLRSMLELKQRGPARRKLEKVAAGQGIELGRKA